MQPSSANMSHAKSLLRYRKAPLLHESFSSNDGRKDGSL